MSLAIPKKKKIIRIIIVIASLVDALLDNNTSDSNEEVLLSLVADAESFIRDFPANEANWSTEQNDVWTMLETIHNGLAPEAPSDPDYEGWASNLSEALARL